MAQQPISQQAIPYHIPGGNAQVPLNQPFGQFPMNPVGGQQFPMRAAGEQAAMQPAGVRGKVPTNGRVEQRPVDRVGGQQFPVNQPDGQVMMNSGYGQHPVSQAAEELQQPMAPAPVSGQVPMDGGDGQESMNLAGSVFPMVDGSPQFPQTSAGFTAIDTVMAKVAGTELEEPYWKIAGTSKSNNMDGVVECVEYLLTNPSFISIDSIFYYIRNDRWAKIPNVDGNYRTKRCVEASHQAVGPPPPYVPAEYDAYRASLPEDEEMRQLITDHYYFATDAFDWAVNMDRYGALEIGYGKIGQFRPIIATLHGKLAKHEQQGVDWDASKHDPVSHDFQSPSIKNVPEALAEQEWKRRQKAFQTRTKFGFTQASFSDAPRTEQEEKEAVKGLVKRMVNEARVGPGLGLVLV